MTSKSYKSESKILKKFKIGSLVIVKPFSNPEGKVAKIAYLLKRGDGKVAGIVQYVDGLDSYKRETVRVEDITSLELVSSNLEVNKLLFD